MAVIEKRGELQWRARVRKKGYPDQSETFTHKADAERWAKETEVAMERGAWQDSRAAEQTFAHYAERYLAEVTPTKRSAKSEMYRIRTLLAAPEFKRPIGKIRAADVAAYRDRRLKEPPKRQAPKDDTAPVQAMPKATKSAAVSPPRTVSPQTVLHELNTLSAIFNHAQKEWSIPLDLNPARNVRKPTRAKPRERRASPQELEWLDRAAQASFAMPEMVVLAVETSMRLGELLSLEWAHINFKQRTAHLPKTKNGDSRTVALSSRAIAALKAIKATTTRKSRAADTTAPTYSFALSKALKARDQAGKVFHWKKADSFEKTWARCVLRARALYTEDCARQRRKPAPGFLTDIRFHTLRHEATSRLFEAGLNPFEVASMTGHKSMQMLKRYTHVEASKLALKLR